MDDFLKKMLADRLPAYELIDFLNIPVEEIIDTYEDLIIDNLRDILELAGLDVETDDE